MYSCLSLLYSQSTTSLYSTVNQRVKIGTSNWREIINVEKCRMYVSHEWTHGTIYGNFNIGVMKSTGAIFQPLPHRRQHTVQVSHCWRYHYVSPPWTALGRKENERYSGDVRVTLIVLSAIARGLFSYLLIQKIHEHLLESGEDPHPCWVRHYLVYTSDARTTVQQSLHGTNHHSCR